MTTLMKGGIVVTGAVLGAVLLVASPAMAQTYGGGYGGYNGYNYSGYNLPLFYTYIDYGTNYQAPMIMPTTQQSAYIPTYMNMPSYNFPSMNMPGYSNSRNYPHYSYPTNNYPVAVPQYQQYQPQYQNFGFGSGNTYTNPSYSYPEYDSSYAPYSNYYTTYPQDNMGYTGDTNALGAPLCYWQDYGRSDCSFNPHQWIYDPYSGTWY